MKQMNIIVSGSRNWRSQGSMTPKGKKTSIANYAVFSRTLTNWLEQNAGKLFTGTRNFMESPPIVVMTPECDGPGRMARRFLADTDNQNLNSSPFNAKWNPKWDGVSEDKGPLDKAAAFKRDDAMLTHATHLLLFWDGKSTQTEILLKKAQQPESGLNGLSPEIVIFDTTRIGKDGFLPMEIPEAPATEGPVLAY